MTVSAGNAAVFYSDNAVRLLEDEEFGLKPQLSIILDPKYRYKKDQDDVYEQAKEAARLVLNNLRDEAKDKETRVASILETLITVRILSFGYCLIM